MRGAPCAVIKNICRSCGFGSLADCNRFGSLAHRTSHLEVSLSRGMADVLRHHLRRSFRHVHPQLVGSIQLDVHFAVRSDSSAGLCVILRLGVGMRAKHNDVFFYMFSNNVNVWKVSKCGIASRPRLSHQSMLETTLTRSHLGSKWPA